MNKKIIISGKYIDSRDFQYIDGSHEELSIVILPKLSEMDATDLSRLHREAADADLVIIALFGSDIRHMPKLSLENITAAKVLWSFDSHHQWVLERQFQDLFDRLFISHSPYLKFYDKYKVEWLPCCFVRYGIDDLLTLHNQHQGNSLPTYDLAFPFKPHPIGSRNTIATALNAKLKHLKLSAYVGQIESGKPYLELLQSSRVILNISLIDDLNIRNFEAWAMNRVLLTNPTPDHKRIADLPPSTIFFKRDLSDLEHRLEEAIQRASININTTPFVLNAHMQLHRYVHMINTVLGTHYKVKSVDYPLCAGIPAKTQGARVITSMVPR